MSKIIGVIAGLSTGAICLGAGLAGGSPAASASASPGTVRVHTCDDQLAAIRHLSNADNAGLRPGDNFPQALSNNGPATWAGIARRAGLTELARSAAAVHNDPTAHRFVIDVARTWLAREQGKGCVQHN